MSFGVYQRAGAGGQWMGGCFTAHPPTGLGQASAPSLSLDFLIFKAEIRIPAYLTEGESN